MICDHFLFNITNHCNSRSWTLAWLEWRGGYYRRERGTAFKIIQDTLKVGVPTALIEKEIIHRHDGPLVWELEKPRGKAMRQKNSSPPGEIDTSMVASSGSSRSNNLLFFNLVENSQDFGFGQCEVNLSSTRMNFYPWTELNSCSLSFLFPENGLIILLPELFCENLYLGKLSYSYNLSLCILCLILVVKE